MHSAAPGRVRRRDQTSSLPLSPALLGSSGRRSVAIRYGAVELVIHDGRVVQLERQGESPLRS